MEIKIPGYGDIEIKNLVLDFNGTLASDGCLINGVAQLIQEVSQTVNIYVITADTFGSVRHEMKELPVKVIQIETDDERYRKLETIKKLDCKVTATIGNGSNDEWMLKESRLGICIMGPEGCSIKALNHADLVISDIQDALELFIFPNRLIATLRY